MELIPNPEANYKEHVKGIVNFLKSSPTLSKTVIGEFLGVDKPLNKDCLMEFID
jgi:Sec7-like guanine-nucleotide exchange factor